jgi:phosphoglycolate phosphatase
MIPALRNLKAVVFDLDGTLIDSALDLHHHANIMLESFGLPHCSLEEVTGFTGHGMSRLVERCLDRHGCLASGDPPLDLAIARFEASYTADPGGHSLPYPGAVALLDMLKARGLKLGLCTNKPHGLTRAVLRAHGLDGFFEAVEGAHPARPPKPHPQPLTDTLSALGVSPRQALYVGDSEVDEEVCERAGVAFALFSGGYRHKPATEFRADLVFDAFPMLLRQLDLVSARSA